jgi:hypothetical protein
VIISFGSSGVAGGFGFDVGDGRGGLEDGVWGSEVGDGREGSGVLEVGVWGSGFVFFRR